MLSKEQTFAINTLNKQLLVISCPGSGKTTVIVERAAEMLRKGIDPDKILVSTFTKEAAVQMQKRFEDKYGKTNIFFGTIHALCYRVISKAFGYRKEDILRATEQWDFFRRNLYKKVETDDLEEFIKNMIGEISYIRNVGISLSDYTPQYSKKEYFIPMYEGYDEYKKNMGKIDFDDMLILCKKCFKECPEELAFWKKQFSHMMIDEYQDTNLIQADIFYLLAGIDGNICVVGDDDQSIYRFRGADSSIFLSFPHKFKNCETVHLSTNYRSEPEIIKRAEKLILNNNARFRKEFSASKNNKGLVQVTAYDGVKEQAHCVANKINRLLNQGVPYTEMAVLYRTNSQNQLLIGTLLKNNITFYTTESPKDYHNEFMFGDIMAYYRLAEGNWENGDVQRILNRPERYLKAGIFKGCAFEKNALLQACAKAGEMRSKYMIKIFELFDDIQALKGRSPESFCRYLLDTMKYRDFVDSFANFCQKDKESTRSVLNMLVEEGKNYETMEQWKSFADYYAEQLQKKKRERRKEGICLSTLHSSKGLEWDNVFIIDANEDIAPYVKAETPEDYEEERRLFYVGVTRARKNVYISYTAGGEKKKGKSRYISEMGFSDKEIEIITLPNAKDLAAKPILCKK